MPTRTLRILTGTAALWLFATGPAAAEEREQPQNLATAEVLPAAQLSGPGYRLGPEVVADGFAQHFKIRTPGFGDFEAASNYQLGVRLLEVRALGVLKEMGTSETFAKAIVKAGAAPIVLVKNLATRPVETITAVPKGIAKGAKKAVTWLAGDRRQRAETESGATKEAIGFSRRKRAFAARLDVDPYTSNVAVQDELDRIAWASFSGGITLSVAFAAVGVPPVVGLGYRVTRLQKTTHELVTGMSGGDLHKRNRSVLQGLGLDPERIEEFLDNPHMSPTHKTALSVALAGLAGCRGLERVIELGIEVKDEAATVRLMRMAELANGYHRNVEPVAKLLRHRDALILYTRVGVLWTDWTAGLRGALTGAPMGVGEIHSREVWLSGVASPRAREGLAAAELVLLEQAGERLEAHRANGAAETATP